MFFRNDRNKIFLIKDPRKVTLASVTRLPTLLDIFYVFPYIGSQRPSPFNTDGADVNHDTEHSIEFFECIAYN